MLLQLTEDTNILNDVIDFSFMLLNLNSVAKFGE